MNLRIWQLLLAYQSERAARVLTNADQQRRCHVAELYDARFEISAEGATNLARLEYAAFVRTRMVLRNDYSRIACPPASLLHNLITSKHQA